MLHGAFGGASLGCWGRQSPLSPEPAGEGRGISSNVPGERSGVYRIHWLHLPQLRGSYKGTQPLGQSRRGGKEGNKMVQSSMTVSFFFRQDLELKIKKKGETTRRAVKDRTREVHGQEEGRIEQGELCSLLWAHLDHTEPAQTL